MTDIYGRVSNAWSKIFYYEPPCLFNPLVYLGPLADLNTFLVIAAQCIWTWIFIEMELGADLTYDTTAVFGILSATLGFILPLRMNAALGKNKACLDNYNAFLGDVQAFAWDIIAFHTYVDETTGELQLKNGTGRKLKSLEILSNIFDILVALPALSKWHFRGGADFNQLYTKSNFKGEPPLVFWRTSGGRDIISLSKKIPSMAKPEVCFFKLLDYTKDLGISKTQQQQGASLRSWERSYGSWGNMGNLAAYTPPVVFTYVLNIALLMYTVILPFQFVDNGNHAIWMVAIVGYFFFGLNSAGSKVGNAFAEGPQGFQTVTTAQKEATKTMTKIWEARFEIFKDPEHDPHTLLHKSGRVKSNMVSLGTQQQLYQY